MYALSDAILALFRASYHPGCALAVEIGLDTPLRYCTGAAPIQIDSDWYTPRGLEFRTIQISEPKSSKLTLSLDDIDGALAAVWYDVERWSKATATVHLIDSGTVVLSQPWHVTNCQRSGLSGKFAVNLGGAGGLRPKAGLETGDRAKFPFAPTPGTAFRVGSASFVVPAGYGYPPPPPGAGWSVFDLPMAPFTNPPPTADTPAPALPAPAPAQPQGGTSSS